MAFQSNNHFALFTTVKVNNVKNCSITWNNLEDIAVHHRTISLPGGDLEYRVSEIIDIDFRQAHKLKIFLAFPSPTAPYLPGPIPHGICPHGLRILKLKFSKTSDFNNVVDYLFAAKIFDIDISAARWLPGKIMLRKEYHKLPALPAVTRAKQFGKILQGWRY